MLAARSRFWMWSPSRSTCRVLQSLSKKRRDLALDLVAGMNDLGSRCEVRVSPGRISQCRRELVLLYQRSLVTDPKPARPCRKHGAAAGRLSLIQRSEGQQTQSELTVRAASMRKLVKQP